MGVGYAVSAFVQTLARTVERQGNCVACDMDIEIDIGIGELYIWAHTAMLHPIVHDGIFHAVGDELRMTEKIGIYGSINEETGFGSHVLCPV